MLFQLAVYYTSSNVQGMYEPLLIRYVFTELRPMLINDLGLFPKLTGAASFTISELQLNLLIDVCCLL